MQKYYESLNDTLRMFYPLSSSLQVKCDTQSCCLSTPTLLKFRKWSKATNIIGIFGIHIGQNKYINLTRRHATSPCEEKSYRESRDVLSEAHKAGAPLLSLSSMNINNHYESCCSVSPCCSSNCTQFPFSWGWWWRATCKGHHIIFQELIK